MNQSEEKSMSELVSIVAKLAGVTPEALVADIEKRKQAKLRSAVRQHERYEDAKANQTEAQSKTIAKMKSEGWKLQSGMRQSRATGLVVRFMHKDAFDPVKHRVGNKMAVIYPDGSSSQIFGKSIAVNKEY